MSNNEKPNRPWVPIQILAVSFLFGPAAAGAVTGINFNRLGKPKFLLPCIIVGTVLCSFRGIGSCLRGSG